MEVLTPGGDCLTCLLDAVRMRSIEKRKREIEKLSKGGKRRCRGHKDSVVLDQFGQCPKCGGFVY